MDDKKEAARLRKAAERERKKALGSVEVRVVLSQKEVERLDEICQGRARLGAEPYSRDELITVLINKDYDRYQVQLAKVQKTPCPKCKKSWPEGCERFFAGDSKCRFHYVGYPLAP